MVVRQTILTTAKKEKPNEYHAIKQKMIYDGIASRQSFYNWEKGLSSPNRKKQAVLAEALSINPDFILLGKKPIFKK